AVGDDQYIVSRTCQHVDEIADLTIGTVLLRVDDNVDGQVRKLGREALRDGEGGIRRVAHSEHELITGVILLAEGPKVRVEAGFRTTQGFEYRDRGAVRTRLMHGLAPAVPQGKEGQQRIGR